MTYTSLDSIVKNILLKRRYSLHWYLDFLVYAKDGLRELAFDLPILALRATALPVNQDDNTVELPNDYQDYTRVSAWVDQYIRPLVETDALQLIPNYDSDFNLQPYSQGIAVESQQQNQYVLYNGSLWGYWWLNNWNVFGENLGRQFGGVGTMYDTFRVDKAHNRLQLNQNLFITNIVLEYISDGMDADSATQIDSYAQMAIESFCMWQFYLHNRTYSQSEADDMRMQYIAEVQKLRARLSDLTIDRLKRIIQSNSISVKY